MGESTVDVREFDVEFDADAADPDAEVYRCPFCDRPFLAARQRDLHLGEVHGERLADDRRAAYEDARAAEEDELFVFHMKVVVALGLLYASTVLLYTAVVGFTG